MALTTLSTAFTSYGPLLQPEVWTCSTGVILICTDAAVTDPDQGVVLQPGQQKLIPAGMVIWARALGDPGVVTRVNRETDVILRNSRGPLNARITGTPGMTTGNDILNPTGTGYFDATLFSALVVQIVPTGTITAGAIVFEQSGDGVNWLPAVAADVTTLNSNPIIAAYAVVTGTPRAFAVMRYLPLIRARPSTAMVGGSVQAFTTLVEGTIDFPVVNVQQTTAASLAVTATALIGTGFTLLSAAGTNATSVTAVARNCGSVSLVNYSASPRFVKLYNKATAPTVGTDTPLLNYMIPANSNAHYAFGPSGQRFSAGIGLAIVANQAIADATGVAAGDVSVTLSYV